MSNTDPSIPVPEPAEVDPVADRDAEDEHPVAPAPAFRTPTVGSGLTPDTLEAELGSEADTPHS